MSVDRAILDEHEHLREIVKCAILHSRGERNLAIGRKLGINATRVTRNIQEAAEKGIIRVEVHPPPEEEIAEKLREEDRLREAHVFYIGVAEEITNMLAKLSADYLDKCLDDEEEKTSRIAIGPGSTMLAFVRALSDKRRPEMEVVSTAAAAFVETYIASNILVGIPVGKWECEFRRFDPEKMSREEQRDYADIFVFGIGKIPDMGGATALALLAQTDTDESALERALYKLVGYGGVGIINYQPIDEEGNPLDWDIEGFNNILKPTVLKLDVIKEIAANEKKKVICIAGGTDKVKGIRAGLRGGYFNVLITDYETAAAVLER